MGDGVECPEASTLLPYTVPTFYHYLTLLLGIIHVTLQLPSVSLILVNLHNLMLNSLILHRFAALLHLVFGAHLTNLS